VRSAVHPVFKEVSRKQNDLKAEQEAQYHIKCDIHFFPKNLGRESIAIF
jgi:hypothetical protein